MDRANVLQEHNGKLPSRKKHKFLSFRTTWVDLEGMILPEISHRMLCFVPGTDKHHRISHMNVKKGDFMKVDNRVVCTGAWGQ